MSDRLNKAIEQDELRKVLSQTAYSYFKEKESVASVIEKITALNENADYPLETSEIEEIVKSKSKIKAQEDKTVLSMNVPNLVDVVMHQGKTHYLLTDGTVVPSVVEEGVTYIPPQKNNLPPDLLVSNYNDVERYVHAHQHIPKTDDTDKYGPFRNPSDSNYSSVACPECGNLFESLREYHQAISEMPNEMFYTLLAAWDFHTYTIEKSNFSPIIYFYSVAERGKSRTLKGLNYVAYRGLIKQDVRDAQLMRECTNIKSSLIFDCTDFWKKVTDAGSEDVILSRFERGITVTRVNRPEKGAFLDTDYYNVFGPTVIATNKIIDEIADTRAVCVIMRKAKRDFDREIEIEDGRELKARLIAYRLAHYNDKLPKVDKLVSSRLGDILRPLHQILMAVAPYREEELHKLTIIIKSKKLEDRSTTINGEIIKSMILCKNLVHAGKIKNQLIVNEVNSDRSEREKIGAKTVSNLIKSMGFDLAVMGDGSRGFFYNENLLFELTDEYGIVLPAIVSGPYSSVPPVVSELL